MPKIDDLYTEIPQRKYTDQLAAAGLAIIPLVAKDRPAGRWKTIAYTPGQDWPWPGYGVRCGVDSGNLECLDFDREGIFEVWLERLRERDPRLHEIVSQRGTIVETPAKGRHLFYRCTAPVGGSQKLAVASEPFTDCTGKQKTCLIETRGEGAYAAIPPTAPECHPANRPYKIVSSTGWYSVPKLDPGQRETLLAVARSFDARTPARAHGEEGLPPGAGPKPSPTPPMPATTTRPGDDFAARGKTIEEMLVSHGWALVSQADGVSYMRRPGKTSGISATVGYTSDTQGRRALHVFSSNAPPFDTGRVYNPYSVYTLLEHSGDFRASAKGLAREGFGEPRDKPKTHSVAKQDRSCVFDFDSDAEDWTGALSPQRNAGSVGIPAPDDDDIVIRDFGDLDLKVDLPEREYLFFTRPKDSALGYSEPFGFMPREVVSLLIGWGGVGKSWALLQMAVSIATGEPWLDLYDPGSTGAVLILMAEEDHLEIKRRIHAIGRALKLQDDKVEEIRKKLFSVEILPHQKFTQGFNEREIPRATEYFESLHCKLSRYRDDWAAVILDPLSRLGGVGTETDASFATTMIQTCERLRTLPGNPGVVLSHHASKAHGATESQAAARGSSALTDGGRWQANMIPMPVVPGCPELLKISVPKSNYTKKTPAEHLYREDGSGVLRAASWSMVKEYHEAADEQKRQHRQSRRKKRSEDDD